MADTDEEGEEAQWATDITMAESKTATRTATDTEISAETGALAINY
jgi:hypothetical protein